MANLTFDPQNQLGTVSQGITGLPVLISLPSRVNPFPGFVIGVSTSEDAQTSSQITGMPITDGDLTMKSARAPGSFRFDLVISETPAATSQQVVQITKVVQQIANVASSIFGGSVTAPNLSGVSSSFVTSQLVTLQNMKDGFQPIFALNLYMPLNAFSIRSSYLSSSWYIERLSFNKREAERGVVATITLKELLNKTASGGPGAVVENLANQLLGPGVGSSVASAARAVTG
jgi:hypothetical protein